jgi:hypothetical protein
MKESLLHALNEQRRSPKSYPEDRFHGRGIVICAGGPRYFTCAWVLIHVLRRLHQVDWPIQVWHLGGEISDEMRLLLEDMKVEVVDAESIVGRFPARISGGWPLKPYAIAQSRFREVLYLDADTVPLVDPRHVFDWDAYHQHGMLLWPDLIDLKASNPIWNTLGLEPRDCLSVDAAVLAVDKQRAWDVLTFAVLLNEHADAVYGSLYGDKDTFLLSVLLVDRKPAIIPHRPFAFDIDLVQRDPAGDPFIHHRTGSKWNLSGPNAPLAREALMPHCDEALADLRQSWSGVVFHPPQRSGRAKAEESRLAAARYYHYETWVTGGRRLELLCGGRVGEGRDDLEQHWAVIERNDAFVLQFYSATRLTTELLPCADGSWQGQTVTPSKINVRLVDEPARRTWPHHGCKRIASSGDDLVTILLEGLQFAAGFDSERALELRAALSLLNDRYDDVPEQLNAQLARMVVPERWATELASHSSALALRRDRRMELTRRASYPQKIDPDCYDRVP